MPNIVGVTIWISGNARPMPSASTSGIFICAATLNGVVEFKPPASIETVCVICRPRYSSSVRNARMISSPLGSFSTITVGAPIIADGTTSASSGTSSTATRVTAPCSRIACCARSFPMYGLPPPPVPRTAAPTARSSRSDSTTLRMTSSSHTSSARRVRSKSWVEISPSAARQQATTWSAPTDRRTCFS